jgi:hypothetical protein
MPKVPYCDLIKGNAFIASSFIEAYTVNAGPDKEIRFTHGGASDGSITMECIDCGVTVFTATLNRDQQQAIRLGLSTSITGNENSG